MGYQVIRQPDGLLAVFSSYSGEWAGYDLTAKQIIKWHVKQAARDARRHMKKVVAAVVEGRPERVYYQFTKTFDEAQAAHAENGGEPVPFGFLTSQTSGQTAEGGDA